MQWCTSWYFLFTLGSIHICTWGLGNAPFLRRLSIAFKYWLQSKFSMMLESRAAIASHGGGLPSPPLSAILEAKAARRCPWRGRHGSFHRHGFMFHSRKKPLNHCFMYVGLYKLEPPKIIHVCLLANTNLLNFTTAIDLGELLEL